MEKKFNLGASLCKSLKDKIVDVILENMNAFAWFLRICLE